MNMETIEVIEVSQLLSQAGSLSVEQLDTLVKSARSSVINREKVRDDLNNLIAQDGSIGSDTNKSLIAAQCFYALCDYNSCLEWLNSAGSGAEQSLLKSKCLHSQKDYEGALANLDQAGQQGHDSFEVAMASVDILRDSGDIEKATEKLNSVASVGEIRAEFHYQLGRLNNANGLYEEAMNEYEKAIELDANHVNALFHMAYCCDLYGDENEAIEFYKQCVDSGVVHVNALLNLAVLFEEAGQYDRAKKCIRRVISAYPNHQRARLFMKDIESSSTMLYDEEQEKRIDRHNQVLEIPISDFELSVRSRNCLKKMNIRTLGDLLRVTESELLAYKNFGETSLQEIKVILTQKGLRLGQMLEDPNSSVRRATVQVESNEEYNTPISELDLTIRARKALQRLNMQTIGDLVKCTEAELLGCKNFGMMSLDEIKKSLNERGLSLRRIED